MSLKLKLALFAGLVASLLGLGFWFWNAMFFLAAFAVVAVFVTRHGPRAFSNLESWDARPEWWHDDLYHDPVVPDAEQKADVLYRERRRGFHRTESDKGEQD
ncbi:MAG: hypothetical protein JJ899_14160 [Alphaproteobacteria bacterium]|nr:hypothetical protein [Alphaproteobacteria bacterium]